MLGCRRVKIYYTSNKYLQGRCIAREYNMYHVGVDDERAEEHDEDINEGLQWPQVAVSVALHLTRAALEHTDEHDHEDVHNVVHRALTEERAQQLLEWLRDARPFDEALQRLGLV